MQTFNQMKKIRTALFILLLINRAAAQETIYPAPAQQGTIALAHGIIHIGNGQVIEDGIIVFSKGKIIEIHSFAPITDVKVIDVTGKHIYPGLINAATNLGLSEISSIRATSDEHEVGELNPNIRSIIAYNSDSKIINTLRSNGILLANIIPQGGIISGSSSVVQLDAWNWEDAAYKTDGGIHFFVPNLAPESVYPGAPPVGDKIKEALRRIDKVRSFFYQAKAYFTEAQHEHTNLKFESVRGLFNQTQTFFVHAELVKEILVATEFAKEFNFKTVVLGGTDSWKIADLLKENNIPVLLGQLHSLPVMQDDDVDQPYKTPYLLQKAGVLFAISDASSSTRGRNLMFNAGTAAGYGLTKEEALQSITLNAAKILGIDASAGTLEKGKDANIVVSNGDILDMKSNKVTLAFIQGRQLNLDNKQKQLYEKYKYKYSIK